MIRFAFLALCVHATSLEDEKPPDPVVEAYRAQVLKISGDSTHGKAVFESEKSGCTRCHTVGPFESKSAPKLDNIADKYSREQLVEALLNPSAEILAGYSSMVIVTKSGDTHAGILRERGESHRVLSVATGDLVRIAVADIVGESVSKTSLMPFGIHEHLSPRELADLVSYLGTLRQAPDPRRTFAVPDSIPMLSKPVRLEPIYEEDQKFDQPLWFDAVPGTTGAFVVLERRKGIFLFEKTESGTRKTLYVDLRNEMVVGGIAGVMGMAFHPRFTENRKYYVNYHIDGAARVVERQAADDFRRDSGTPSRVVLQIDQWGHMGGMILFGADGYLYIGTGDGASQGDPEGDAQNLRVLGGAILRIDVDRRDPGLEYAIPESNPFFRHPDPQTRREIWAYGIRQAWRFSFDSLTGDLWLGDVGQVDYEEITLVRAGENLGWNIYEGFMPFSDRYQKSGVDYEVPVVALARKYGVSVTGGYVYRGKRSRSYRGVYIFGDWDSKRVWGLKQRNGKLLVIRQIATSPGKVSSFGVDHEGEIYVVGYDDGMIYRLCLEESVFE